MARVRRFLLRLLSFFRSGRAETELAREITAHLQLLEDQFVAEGMSAEEARYAAKRTFGGVEQVKERQRDTRSFRSLANSWMDFKLGARMLIKYPGLTLVGGLGIAVAVAIAAGAFSIIANMLTNDIPLDEGDRVVQIQNWDVAANNPDRRIVYDFHTWREQLSSIQDLGAFTSTTLNLIAPGGVPETVQVAEMTAAGFRLARVPPFMGRYLLDEDERQGAPPVVVIGHDVWQRRFANDPAIVGRVIALGDTTYTIAGVMPAGFAFPIDHSFWIPLRLGTYAPRRGPSLYAFGRLATGATAASAQAELTTLGQRTAAAFPKTHERLRPQVVPYSYPFSDMDEPENQIVLRLMLVIVTMLLVVVCVNVAILVYARIATRRGEIAVRSALGASRRRIVAQLFVEALVLAAVAAGAGLAIAAAALGRVEDGMLQIKNASRLPFWMSFGLTAEAVLYVAALTILAAAIVGIVPALKATGPRVQAGLQSLSAGGGSRMQMGRTWSVLIVVQIAVAVALLPAAVYHAWTMTTAGAATPGFPAEEFLSAQIFLDRPAAAKPETGRQFRSRFADRYAEVGRRLGAEPAIADVTFSREVPGREGPVWVEAGGVPMPPKPQGHARQGSAHGHRAAAAAVDLNFLDVFDVPVLAGRGFGAGDATDGASVIVNRSFVERVLGGGDALGRQIRYVGLGGDAPSEFVPMGRWFQIVGVVGDFPPKPTGFETLSPRVYHASTPDRHEMVVMWIRVRGEAPIAFAGRLREISAAVDPNLQLRRVLGMDGVLREEQGLMRVVAVSLVSLTLSVVLLSAGGIYALMSFTVSQRRREIGIRAALGADARRILGSIFSRAFRQLAIGAFLGAATAASIEIATDGVIMNGKAAIVLPIVTAFMILVALLAALGPARRGLRINPTEALKQE